MRYGAHADAAFLQLGAQPLRSDLSCTIFLGDPAGYEGGALTIHLGTRSLSFRGAPGSAIVYPSDRLHEVEPVTKGERLRRDHLHPEPHRRPPQARDCSTS